MSGAEAEAKDMSTEDDSKKRKRPRLNCAECRRLKLKCDREVPCAHCVKRKCQDLCPDGYRQTAKSTTLQELKKMQEQVKKLQKTLKDNGIMSATAANDGDKAPAVDDDQNSGSDTEYEGGESESEISRTEAGPSAPTQASGSMAAPAAPPLPTIAGVSPTAESSTLINGVSLSTGGPSVAGPSVSNATALAVHLPAPTPAPGRSSSMNDPLMLPAPMPLTMDNLRAPSFPSPSFLQPAVTEQSHGTLVLSRDGRSKYLGPSAASEWLKDQEVQEADVRESVPPSRAASPQPDTSFPLFPFSAPARMPSTATILASVPEEDEAHTLTSSYHRYFGWSYNIAPRDAVDRTLREVYKQRQMARPVVDLQALALVFMVLAMGTLHNLELAPNDPVADTYVSMAKTCLVKDSFMTKNTIAGVQTLNVMAHYNLETDRGRNGDAAWPLWGLAMRIIQAMGLHRDGAKWNLPPDILEERRRIFWETHSAEVFQANCFSRPCSISPEFVDASYPSEGMTYSFWKFQLCRVAECVLRNALLVHPGPPNSGKQLYDQILVIERQIPFPLRCRTALVSLTSLYTDPNMAIADSPEVNRRDLRRTFEQHHLALITSEAVVNLYRPLYMQALAERPDDPTRSNYALPFLAVIERNNAIIQIAVSLYSLYPTVTARHWWVWYHAFNAAVCMGTLMLMSPLSDFAHIALALMDQVSSIYTSLIQTRAAPRPVQNLQWILRLRERAVTRMTKSRAGDNGSNSRDEENAIDSGLLGWKTRLIERAAVGQLQTARTISTVSPAQSNTAPFNEVDNLIMNMPQVLQNHVVGGPEPNDQQNPMMLPDSLSTDQLLHQFWDPVNMPMDSTGDTQNWWDLLFNMPP